MKRDKFSPYIYWGVTAFLVIAASVGLNFLLQNLEWIKDASGKLGGILAPIIYGAVLAYLLTPVYNRVRNRTEKVCTQAFGNVKKKNLLSAAGKFAGTLASLILLLVVVIGLFSMLLPELMKSFLNIMDALPSNIQNFQVWLQQMMADNPRLEQTVLDYFAILTDKAQNWLYTDVVPNINKIIISISTSAVGILVVAKNILIGLVVMAYLLNIKETLQAQGKKMIYGLFPLRIANKVLEEGHYIHSVFGGFIIGKLLDSLIIGIICFVCMSVMKMPYVLLVSVIVGVTNIIPFFGPFIGAAPSAIMILLVNPTQCLYFLIFILLLQQFDGNILGPKILGDSTGLSSFWVLFSILLFGGWFGFVGMVIGVPAFAVIYKLLSEFISMRLRKKELNLRTESYRHLKHIEEETKIYRRSEDAGE